MLGTKIKVPPEVWGTYNQWHIDFAEDNTIIRNTSTREGLKM